MPTLAVGRMSQFHEEHTTSNLLLPPPHSQPSFLGSIMFENIAWGFQSALPHINWMVLDKVPYFMKLKPPVNVRYTGSLCATQKKKTEMHLSS